jgi:lipopolysaccharide/colanic/teichoic acid biosynthesis glycosyltransferase
MSLLVKRATDLVISALVLVVLLPLWIFIAIWIKLDSKGPVFFTQERPGLNKKIFKLYKFRSMKINSDTMIKGKEVAKDDDRITSAGRFLRRSKLDEIPQLLNIIKGDMSLVGPRPERIDSLEDYTEEILKRLNMRPGLTGLAQVSGNIHLALNKRYELDVYYVEHFSLLLDLKIIIRTIGVVIFGEERYSSKPMSALRKDAVNT